MASGREVVSEKLRGMPPLTGGRYPARIDSLTKLGEIRVTCDNLSGGELTLQVWRDTRRGGVFGSLTVWKAGKASHVVLREEKLRALGLLTLMHVPEPPAPPEVEPAAEQQTLLP
jgi:hypothetical protein